MADEQKCRYFNGLIHPQCDAGIAYADVRDDSAPLPTRWPCMGRGHAVGCAQFEHYTAEEIADFDKRVNDAISEINAFAEHKTDACPQCGKQVTKLVQVGRCVYTRPCGHRLWQGQIPKAWR